MPKGTKTVNKRRVSSTQQLPCGRIYQGSIKATTALIKMHAKGCEKCEKALAAGTQIMSVATHPPCSNGCQILARAIKSRNDKLAELKGSEMSLTTAAKPSVNWQLVKINSEFGKSI